MLLSSRKLSLLSYMFHMLIGIITSLQIIIRQIYGLFPLHLTNNQREQK